MAINLVKAEISRFLRSSEPEVLCIKGKWGVGKTYAWKQILGDISSKEELGLKNYAYVSLFGLNSLESLKKSIFEDTVGTNKISDGPSISTYAETISTTHKIFRKCLPVGKSFISQFVLSGMDDFIDRVSLLLIREQIICIDDLERAGEGLNLRDVLGLISMLKEERKCKSVILLNEEQINQNNRKDFEKLLEKVVDVSLTFDPSSQEAVDIAFQKETEINKILRPMIINIGINNIRIIKKIEWLANRLNKILGGAHRSIVEQAMRTVALGAWSFFSPTTAPPFDYIRSFGRNFNKAEANDEDSLKEKTWSSYLINLNCGYPDKIDELIFQGIEFGYFNEQEIKIEVAKKEEEIANNYFDNPFTQAWKLYRESLTFEDEEIFDALIKGAKKSFHLIKPNTFNETILLLKENGKESEASQLIGEYISSRNFEKNPLEEEEYFQGYFSKMDPELDAAFKKIDDDYVDPREPLAVMHEMVKRQGWNDKDIDLLAKQTPEQFEQIFESVNGPDLPRIVKFFVELRNYEGESYKKMGEAVTEGLRRIASKSALRKKWIESYGIDLEEPSSVSDPMAKGQQ